MKIRLLVPAASVLLVGLLPPTAAWADDAPLLVCADSAAASATSASGYGDSPDSDDPDSSSTTTYYTITNTNKDAYIAPPSEYRQYGDPGVAITISRSDGVTWSYGASVTLGTDVGAIVAHASVSLGVTVQRSTTYTQTVSGSWTVPKTAKTRGWLEPGAHGVSFDFVKYHYKAPCTRVVDKQGHISSPTSKSSLWFHHS